MLLSTAEKPQRPLGCSPPADSAPVVECYVFIQSVNHSFSQTRRAPA